LKISLKFGSRFREIFGASEVQIDLEERANILRLLDVLCDSPDRRAKIFDNSNINVRPNVAITKNGRFIIHLDWLQTELFDGDKVEIFSLASGG
jgi:MoaD family protein